MIRLPSALFISSTCSAAVSQCLATAFPFYVVCSIHYSICIRTSYINTHASVLGPAFWLLRSSESQFLAAGDGDSAQALLKLRAQLVEEAVDQGQAVLLTWCYAQ